MNKKLLVFLVVTVSAFLFAVFQYVKEFQSEIADAAYSGKPATGHSWTEMECSSGLCVTSDNKVGIGTSTPGSKLDVAGTINSTGISSSGTISAVGNINSNATISAATDVCIGSGACLSQLNNYIGSQSLLYSAHTFSMCSTTPDSGGYGEVVNIGTTASPVYICKFDASTCPAGVSGQPNWTQYQLWSAGTEKSCSSYECSNSSGFYYCPGSCSVSGHEWGNFASTCTYNGCSPCSFPSCNTCQTTICNGAYQVGCY